jgi:hypothetical protein
MIPAMSVSANSTVRVIENSEIMKRQLCQSRIARQRRVATEKLRAPRPPPACVVPKFDPLSTSLHHHPTPMKLLPRLLAIVALCVAPSLFAATAFEGKVTLGMKSGKEKEVLLTYIMKGQKMRMEPQMEGTQGMAMIFDVEKSEMITLMPEQQMYMVMPIKGAVEAAAKKASSEKMPELVKTGRTETILGYKCEEYTITDRGTTTEMWVTDKLGTYMGASASKGGGMMGRAAASASPAWEAMLKRDGFFPLRVLSRDKNNKETFRMEAKEVQPRSVADSEFQPPAGYQKFAMPNLGGLFGK